VHVVHSKRQDSEGRVAPAIPAPRKWQLNHNPADVLPNEIQIRQANEDDPDLIAPLFDAYRQFYKQPPDLDLARNFLCDRIHQGESVIFVAIDQDGRALGFTQLYPGFSSGLARRIFILNDLFVAPEARRRQIGRRLLDAAANFAREAGAARLTLATARDNVSAQSLYESSGWRRDTVFCTYTLPLSR
jgi:GNAT superfamily N-acetyltransferase